MTDEEVKEMFAAVNGTMQLVMQALYDVGDATRRCADAMEKLVEQVGEENYDAVKRYQESFGDESDDEKDDWNWDDEVDRGPHVVVAPQKFIEPSPVPEPPPVPPILLPGRLAEEERREHLRKVEELGRVHAEQEAERRAVANAFWESLGKPGKPHFFTTSTGMEGRCEVCGLMNDRNVVHVIAKEGRS